MPPITPSTTATITVGNVGTTLGNATKNMGGFRGFGGSVPSSGPISMSQCQKIQKGVGFHDNWFRANAGSYHGRWVNTSITNNGSFTVVVWVSASAINTNWRNMYHITTESPSDGVRRPATWIVANSTGFHVKHDSASGGNQGVNQTTTRMVFNSTAYMVTAVYNSLQQSVYINGTLSDTFTSPGTFTNSLTTDLVLGPDTYYATTGDFSLKNLWFFPYPMTAAQVSAYYNSLSGIIGTPSYPSNTTALPSNEVATWDSRLSTAFLNSITYSSSTYSWSLAHSSRTVYIMGFTGLPNIPLSRLRIVWTASGVDYTVVDATNTNLSSYNNVTIGLGAVAVISRVTFYCYVNDNTVGLSLSGDSFGMLNKYTSIKIYGS